MTRVAREPMALGDEAARRLATTTKTAPEMAAITPRWLVRLLGWVPVEAGVYRVNKVVHPESVHIQCDHFDESPVPETFVDNESEPEEFRLTAVHTILDVHTRISDLYSSPHDQIAQQLRLTIESIKERQEGELINSPHFGLIAKTAKDQRIPTIAGPPTPDDLDNLIAKCWKEPGFFLTHPRGIAAFGRECTRRGVPPPTVSMFGSQFLTWRGLPLIPSDKVPVTNGKTDFLLIRTGEARQGVVGLYQQGLAGERSPGLSVKFMGIDRSAIASYLVSLYSSLAILTPDATALLEGAQIDKFHDYAPRYHG
ncbi:hypothetical protein D5S18_07485 [Nocardia panacis]|uniref:Type 2A encapsulin shell protein SrpI-like domain-containing protein n=1 Tax=Nocardia panacis TaxID=2340916 RepID=A0A3A4KS43_9NOCA|nr:family 2A encapsulin nanocompartment shell protein [Nocardia panacis]RJO77580.1 hypothetical protein D5S18_07485 [Nocardia panacis]